MICKECKYYKRLYDFDTCNYPLGYSPVEPEMNSKGKCKYFLRKKQGLFSGKQFLEIVIVVVLFIAITLVIL